jgi:glycosyltransferase involved in cell wall biosynthesis
MSNKAFIDRINPKKADRKMKVMFYGDSPTCATGFGQVSRNILPALKNSGRFDVDILGINYWGDPHEYPFNIWPMAINQNKDPYGRQRMQQHLLDPRCQFDILFFLQDTFILEFMPQLLTTLRNAGKNFKSVFYYPIDGVPKEGWVQAAGAVDYPVTYSQFAYQQSVAVVPDMAGRLSVLPHGVNPEVFHPVSKEDARNFRQQFFGSLADKFIFLNVNRNQQRKDIPATIRAFKEFKKHRPNSALYLHMAAVDQGWNLPEVIKAMGLDMSQDVILPQKFVPSNGFPLPVLNLIYNACDAVISTTLGEGWGLSWTEAMAVGKPVIFPSNTCLTEYITDETGFPYPSGGDADHVTIIPNDNEVVRPVAHIGKMVERMLEVHDKRDEAARRAQAGHQMVMNNLVWDKHINPKWVQLFDRIAGEIASPTPATVPASVGAPVPRQVLKGEVL